MPSTSIDRINGAVTSVAIKAPCKAVSTTTLTLSGEQTVGGVACVTGDRVLYALAGGSVSNGIWIVSTGAWSRAPDFDGNRDVVQGTQVLVATATANASMYRVTTANPIVIGTTSIAFVESGVDDLSNLLFTQSGTGAVDRPALDKMRERVSVTDYGATGDGATDDTAAFSAALTHLSSGGELFVPAGTYKITSTLTLPENLTITGVGREKSKVYVSGVIVGMQKLYANHNQVNAMNLIVRNVGFFGASNALGGIRLDYADWVDFEHCGFEDFIASNGYGLRLINVYRWSVRHCHFENINKYGVKAEDGGGSVGCNAGKFWGNEVIGNNQAAFIGLYLESSQEIEIGGMNDFEGSSNGLHAIEMEGCEGVHIHDNYIELWLGRAIKANSGAATKRVTIENNLLNSAGPVIDCNNATTNSNWTVRNNRFPDIGAGVDLISFGSTSRFIEYDNDPDTSDMTPTYTSSDFSVTTVTGTFTGTLTGCTTSPTGTLRYIKTGSQVVLYVPAITATSNTNACTVTGMPTRLQPARVQAVPGRYRDNGVDALGLVSISVGGVLTLTNQAGTSTFFTTSGEKGTAAMTISYSLD